MPTLHGSVLDGNTSVLSAQHLVAVVRHEHLQHNSIKAVDKQDAWFYIQNKMQRTCLALFSMSPQPLTRTDTSIAQSPLANKLITREDVVRSVLVAQNAS